MIIDKLGEGHYQTRDGRPVVIESFKGITEYPITGYVIKKDGCKGTRTWTKEGIWFLEFTPHDLDLIPVEPQSKPLPESETGYKIDLSEASEEERREAQELAFELGWYWGLGKQYVIDRPFLFFRSDSLLTFMPKNEKTYFDRRDELQITLPDLRAAVAHKKEQEGKAEPLNTNAVFTFPASDYTKQVNEDGSVLLTPIDHEYQANYEKALQFLDKTPENVMWPHSDLAKILVEFLNSVK